MLNHIDGVLLLGACLTGVFFILLLKACVPSANPLRLTWSLVREHAVSATSLFYLLTLLGIMFLDILETKYDEVITQHLHWDFTGLFLQIEGSATALFQVVHFQWLTLLLSVVYLYIFPVMGLVCVLATYHGGKGPLPGSSSGPPFSTTSSSCPFTSWFPSPSGGPWATAR